MIRKKKNVLLTLLTLVFLIFSATSVYATIPSGTVVFSNGQALDLTYANNATHQSEVTQDVVNSNGIYVINFGGSFINNSTNATLTPTQVTTLIPAVTYKDDQGNIKNFATGNGAEITVANDVITATAGTASFGSSVTVNITNPVTYAGATQYQVLANDAAVSSKVALDTPTTCYPAQTSGSVVQVEFFNSTGTQVGTTQNVTLTKTTTTPTTTQPTISSVAPITITITAGTAPVLPSTVTATMSDGTTKIVNVTWITPTASQYASAGTFIVTGTIAESTTIKATATVTVVNNVDTIITSVNVIKVTTTPGVAPALPSTVIANMSNGRTELVNVTWANVTPSQYGSEGTFTVSGAIANTTVLAMVNVTVTPAALSFPGENGIDYNLPDGIAGTAYTANIIATGGTPPYNYTLEYPNSLPAGLTMGTDGTISGIPIQDWTETQGMPIGGVADIFTVNVTDSATPTARTVSNKCVLTVRPALGSIPLMFWGPQTCQCYPVVGTPCNCLVTCVYGGTPPYSVALASGSSLPAGLTMGTDGTISGTPTVSGTASFTLIATDSTKPTAETVSAPFNFTVLPALSLPSTTLADGTVGTAYTASISATGGTSLPYSYALASGSSLPTGLTMGTDGTISGTPTASGTTSFTVNVTDIALQTGQTATASQTFSITVLAGNKVTVPVLP